MMKRNVSALVAIFGVTLCGPVCAEDDASSTAAARAVGIEGMKLAESGNCAAAIEKLERAEKLRHAPTTLETMGECHVKLRRLVLGTEILQRVVRESLPPDAPSAFLTAKARAQAVLDDARPRIAMLLVTVEAPPGVQPTVTVDGEPVHSALFDLDRPTDPGSHTLEATASGCLRYTSTVNLKEGQRLPVKVILEIDPNAPRPIVAETPGSAPTSRRNAAETSGGKVAGLVMLGVGAAGLATGAAFGILAIATKSDLDGVCAEKACPPERDSTFASSTCRARYPRLRSSRGGSRSWVACSSCSLLPRAGRLRTPASAPSASEDASDALRTPAPRQRRRTRPAYDGNRGYARPS